MSFSNDRRRGGAGNGFSSTGARTAMGYWLPLALTAGVAAVSIAAWIWSERNDNDAEDEDGHPPNGEGSYQPSVPGSDYPPPSYATGDYTRSVGQEPLPGNPTYDPGMMARMQGALRRTPSPQQIFDGASKRVVAGVTAAGAFVGGALTSIREDNKGEGDFEDHSRWSEEAQARAQEGTQHQAAVGPTMSGGLPSRGVNRPETKKKTVVIVISSDLLGGTDEISEHTSILSHLPEHVDLETSKIFVLIYAPQLKHAIAKNGPSQPPISIDSSYSNIATEEAASADDLTTGALTPVEPRQVDELEGTPRYFRTLYTQAQALVEKDTMIMPFNTPGGFVHLVRHLSPELVYVQESLAGDQGDAVQHISGWVRQVIVVTEDERSAGVELWQKEETVGVGKRIDVVNIVRIGDDWRRRVRGLN